MKTLLTLIAVFALTATCYADVTLDVIDNEDGTGTVQITAVGSGPAVVGIGLIVDADAGNSNDTVADVTKPGGAFFDVYIDYAHDDPNNYTIGDGHPGANPSAAGVLASGLAISLSMGELAVADANTQGLPMDLAIIDMGMTEGDPDTDICLSLDDLRGGLVATNGGAKGVIYGNDLGGCTGSAGRYAITFPNDDPFPACHPDYAEWVTVGKPLSWVGQFKQCYGDADGADEAFGRGNFVAVGSLDVSSLLGGFNDNSYVDPATDPWIAADFNHAAEAFGRGNFVRVGSADVAILLEWFNDPTASVPIDCQDCP
jgi:hypothetical protein